MPTIKVEIEITVHDDLCYFCGGLTSSGIEWHCQYFHKTISCPKGTRMGEVKRPKFCHDAETTKRDVIK